MKKQPIIFAMANPEPEIMPDEVRRFSQMQLLRLGDQIYQIKLIMFLDFHIFLEEH